jgi:hypothetical protein
MSKNIDDFFDGAENVKSFRFRTFLAYETYGP